MTLRSVATLALVASLAGCASTNVSERTHRPNSAPAAALWGDRDGPPADPPADVASRPDAEPRVEAIRAGGANKPYQVFGRDYTPLTRDLPFIERGLASWYGRKFHGRATAIGETYDMYAMTAAHPTMPLPSYARIRNPANGREVIVRVNDRGPFHAGRIVDLSYAAAAKLGLLRGVAPVELERITHADIRAGTWRGGDATRFASAAAAMPAPVTATAEGATLAYVGASSSELGAVDAGGNPSAAGAGLGPSATGAAATHGAPVALVSPTPATSLTPAFWIQLGAFRERSGAEGLHRRVSAEAEALLPGLATFADAALYRVQAGPWPSREQAHEAAQRVRDALGLAPLVVERR